MSELSVTEALASRSSVRAFTQQPVPEAVVREILELAGGAPSGGNVQPWKAYVLCGDALRQVIQAMTDRLASGAMETPEFPTYPSSMQEPWRSRRYDCGERMYEVLGISREDKGGRINQVLKNFQFFGAPVGIIVTMNRSMGESQAIDVGIFIQTIMLLARERGLDTCPQLSWSMWPNTVREALGINADEKVMVGISLGHGEADNPVNGLQQPRVALEDFASLRGF